MGIPSVERIFGPLAFCCIFAAFSCDGSGCRGFPEAETEEGRLQRACDDEDRASCSELAVRLQKIAAPGRVWERVLSLYARGCEEGDQTACTHLEELRETLDGECRGDKIQSCVSLASMYQLGRGVPPDLGRAGKLYKRACDGGELVACNYLGMMYESGLGRPRDLVRAAKLYRQSCESKNGEACSNLGHLYHLGQGVPQDTERALELRENACKGGAQVGCESLGLMYQKGESGITRDPDRASSIFDESCKAGHIPSCRELAHAVEDRDTERAAKLYLNGCDGGDGGSCTLLSMLLGEDQGLFGRDRRVELLLKRGCSQGWPSACYLLAKRETDRSENGPDRQKVHDYQYKVCRYGDVEACLRYGEAWKTGHFHEQDFERAREYYEVACGWRHPAACAHLSVMHRDGLGVPQDTAKAKAYLRLASRWEDGHGCELDEEGCCVAARTPLPTSEETKGIPGQWVLVPAGRFMMGDPADPDEESRHRPHEVTLTRDFHIQTTEVTQAQFLEVMGYNPSSFTKCGGSCPVETVSWHEAATYANRLSERVGTKACYTCTGKLPSVTCMRAEGYSSRSECPGYRLPTQAEWERAARAGTRGPLYTGDLAELEPYHAPTLDPIAWYAGNSMVNDDKAPRCPRLQGLGPVKQERCSTHPVGELCANPWSLRDMLGNVAEWCDDSYEVGALVGSKNNPSGFLGGEEHHDVRGGGWSSLAEVTTAAYREGRFSPQSENDVGFRPVRSVLKAQEAESP